MRKIRALIKFDLAALWDDKLAFVYSVIFPLVFFVFSNWNKILSGTTYTDEQLLIVLAPYLSYVLLTNALNNVVLITYGRRESGFLKMYFFVVGRRYYLLLAPLILYYLITLIECLGFTLIGMFAFGTHSIFLLMAVIFIVTILYFPTCGITSVLLFMPVRQATMTAISGGLLIIFILTYNLSSVITPLNMILLLNPTILFTQLVTGVLKSTGMMIQVSILVFDCLVGMFTLVKLPLISRSSRI